MAKTRKGVFRGDDAANDPDHQCGEGNEVVAEPPPQKHTKNCAKQGEEDYLIRCHGIGLACVAARENSGFHQTRRVWALVGIAALRPRAL